MGWLLILPLTMLLVWMSFGRRNGPRSAFVGVALLLGGIAESLYWLVGFTLVGLTAAWALITMGGDQNDGWYLIPFALGAIPFVLSGLPLMVSGFAVTARKRWGVLLAWIVVIVHIAVLIAVGAGEWSLLTWGLDP